MLCALWFQERLLALKRSVSFMQDMDFSQQAALLGSEDTAVEEPAPEVVPVPVETARKSKRPSREVIRYRDTRPLWGHTPPRGECPGCMAAMSQGRAGHSHSLWHRGHGSLEPKVCAEGRSCLALPSCTWR